MNQNVDNTLFWRLVSLQKLVIRTFSCSIFITVNSNTLDFPFFLYSLLKFSRKSSVTFVSSKEYPRLPDIKLMFWPKFLAHRRQVDRTAPKNYPSLNRQLPEKEIVLAMAYRDLNGFRSQSSSSEEVVHLKEEIEENCCWRSFQSKL